jgi:hypothetical protein
LNEWTRAQQALDLLIALAALESQNQTRPGIAVHPAYERIQAFGSLLDLVGLMFSRRVLIRGCAVPPRRRRLVAEMGWARIRSHERRL